MDEDKFRDAVHMHPGRLPRKDKQRCHWHEGAIFHLNAIRIRECVLFIGTRFSNLYTTVDTPAEAARCNKGKTPKH